MVSPKRTGRIVGGLLFVQMAGLIVPFALLLPVATGRFLTDSGPASSQISLAVGLLAANCALTMGIAFTVWPQLSKRNSTMALLLVALSLVMFLLQIVDNTHIMSMVSLSQRYLEAGSPGEPYQSLAAILASTRKWTHYSELVSIDAWIFLLYSLLYRFSMVPRPLAAFALLTVILHFTGITLPLILGYTAIVAMGATMAFGHVALAVWLMIKGFNEGPCEDVLAK